MDSASSPQIKRILHSQTFANKGQLRKLLEVLAKNMDSQTVLSHELIIKEIWPDEVKTKRSADVAKEMNRLRRALEAYYQQEGKNDPILIVLPNRTEPGADGSYEKRWIKAVLGGKAKDGAPPIQLLPPQETPRRGLTKIALIAALAAALGLAAYTFIRLMTVPDHPKFGRLDGSTLIIMNAEGTELWRKFFAEGFGPDWYYSQGLDNRIWFGDLEGKGHSSVLFVYSPAGQQSQSSTVICYSDRGKEKWRWIPGREIPELAGSAATYKTAAIRVLKAPEKRPRRIVVSSQYHPWWPNQIAILDSKGKAISEYWHSGALTSMVLADLYGDGKEEIIATGVANGYDHQATLVVLDPDRVFGASTEVRPEFQIHNMGEAQEKLRLLFPRSDLNRALFQFNRAADPSVEHGTLRLTVTECITPTPGCAIFYEFDKNLRIIAAYAGSDEFRSAHARFYQTGKGAHTLSVEEQAAFQKVRCLVGCKSEFVPVGNLVP